MVRISFLYPNRQDTRFDMDYYIDKHMPWSIGLLSTHPGFKGVSVERGVNNAVPGLELAYIAVCHFLFDSMEDFMAATTPHLPLLQADMKNYTEVEPVVQISEVLISR
jgi:uncharacterized protein (TIGR02118 family)